MNIGLLQFYYSPPLDNVNETPTRTLLGIRLRCFYWHRRMLKPPEFTKWLSRLRQTTDERIHHSAALKQATRETPGRSKNIRLDFPQFAVFPATAAAHVSTYSQARAP